MFNFDTYTQFTHLSSTITFHEEFGIAKTIDTVIFQILIWGAFEKHMDIFFLFAGK